MGYATVVLFYYDYFLTFGAEVFHIWPQPISVNTSLFFLNRYITFFGNIVSFVLLFSPISKTAKVS